MVNGKLYGISATTVSAGLVGHLYEISATASSAPVPTLVGNLYEISGSVQAGASTLNGHLYSISASVPTSIAVTPSATAPKPGQVVTLTAALAGATAWEWSQVSGPTVTLATNGAVANFTTPYLTSDGTVQVQVRAQVASVWSAWTQFTVAVAKYAGLWSRTSGIWHALKAAIPGTSTAGPFGDASNIPCYGDSMTAGFGIGVPASWPTRLGTYLPGGRTTTNFGVSSQTAQEIAIRQGGMPINLTFPSNTIPASGAVTVTTPDTITWGAAAFTIAGTVSGVVGTLSHPSGSTVLTWTRSGTGSTVALTGAASFRSNAGDRDKVQIFDAGRNDIGVGSVDATIRARVINAYTAMTGYLTTPYCIVMGLLTLQNETSGTRGYNNVVAINQALAAQYGARFLDIRRYLIDNGMAELGITPTTADLAAVAADTMPASLMYDNIHWNAATADLVAQRILEKLLELNYLPSSAQNPTDGLFFRMPDMSASSRKVLAHYFGPYPRSLNNAATISADQYTTVYNNPNYTGIYGTQPANTFGGAFRDRPQFRPPISGDYKYQDCIWDIQQAQAAGIDGFFPDLLGLSGSNYDNYEVLRRACNDLNTSNPGRPFYIAPMIDANGATGAATPQQAAAYVKRFALGDRAKGAAYEPAAWFLPDGRFVVSCFKVEGKDLQWWTDLFFYLKNDWGLDVAFIGVAVNWNSSGTYTSVQYGSSVWGYGADPSVISHAGDYALTAHSRGEKFMAPVVAQDTRPQNSLFDEALNTSTLRAAWDKAITQGADYVQLVTWSDYSETAMAPSAANGWTLLDLNSYYITKWKTGAFPPILRDAIYLSHRGQTLDASITGPQTKFMQHWSRGNMSAVANNVEVLTFLTDAANVTVKVGSATYTYAAPAGMNVATFPAQIAGAGTVQASAVRSSSTVATITSPVAIRASSVDDDRQYFRFSSIRGTAGQFDPATQYA